MLVESAAGRLGDGVDPGSVDWLDLTWIDCRTRFARRRTRGGHEVRILLRLATVLRHGDVLGTAPGGRVVVVNVVPAEVCVARPESSERLVAVAFEMGNLHVPIELTDGHVVAPGGAAVEVALERLGVAFDLATRRFEPTHWPTGVQLTG